MITTVNCPACGSVLVLEPYRNMLAGFCKCNQYGAVITVSTAAEHELAPCPEDVSDKRDADGMLDDVIVEAI